MIVYNKKTKEIKAIIPNDQKPRNYKNIPDEDIGVFDDSNMEIPRDNLKFYVLDDNNGKLIRRPKNEIEEIQRYGRVLTEEERILNKLKPSPEEVKKAENTIEILTLIQEVI